MPEPSTIFASDGGGGVALASCIQYYIRSIVEKVAGLKVLILDQETTGIISLVYSQSQILEKEVFLVERIGSAETADRMPHLTAVCFLRPTPDNFLKLSNELKSPRYGEYHLYFTNVVPSKQLDRLARCDVNEAVQQVQEYYADVFAVNQNLFSLNMEVSSVLMTSSMGWQAYEEALFTRVVEGLFSAVLVTIRQKVTGIRFPRKSDICKRLAMHLQSKLAEESLLVRQALQGGRHSGIRGGDRGSGPSQGTVILLLDRREDPVTPMLNQWTYQAMLHELIGISNNRVDLRKAPGVKEELQEITMSTIQDPFFLEHSCDNFGDLGVAMRSFVAEYQEKTRSHSKLDSIDDMQRFVEQYPEFRRLSGSVSKHVMVVHELSRLVDANCLLEVSTLEQDLACSDSRESHLTAVRDKLQSPKTGNMEKLRLVILFALRYENDRAVDDLKERLRRGGLDPEQVKLVDTVLAFSKSYERSGGLFKSEDFISKAKNAVQRGFKGVPNVYTQHKSLMHGLLEKVIKGKLQENAFPLYLVDAETSNGVNDTWDSSRLAGPSDKQTDVIAFVVGGVTFEEARDVTALASQTGTRLLLGGTTIHNTKSFLADVSQLSRGGMRNVVGGFGNSVGIV